MRQTKNKNMNLPEYADVIDIEQLNENFEIIDEYFTDPDAHAELFLALDEKMSAALKAAIEAAVNELESAIQSATEAATDEMIRMIMMGGDVYTQLACSDGTILCADSGEEIIAVRKL